MFRHWRISNTSAIKEMKAHNLSRGFTTMSYSPHCGRAAKTTLSKCQMAALSPGKWTPYPTEKETGIASEPVWTVSCSCHEFNCNFSVIQPIAWYYKGWDILAPCVKHFIFTAGVMSHYRVGESEENHENWSVYLQRVCKVRPEHRIFWTWSMSTNHLTYANKLQGYLY
jgi:hypothetical protein